MASCVVAGELEASPEAARPYPERVGDFDVPAAGGAVRQRQGGVGRDSQEPVCGGSMDHGRRSWHSDQADEHNTDANQNSDGGHHRCMGRVICELVCLCMWLGIDGSKLRGAAPWCCVPTTLIYILMLS